MKNYPLVALSILLAAFSLSAYGQVNLPNGLMVHLPFTGNANDVSGNGNNGTPNGVTLRPDRGNTANASYEFDGINDNIEIPNSNSFNIVNDRHAISFWFQLCFIPPLGDHQEYYMFSKMSINAGTHGWHIFMRRDTDGNLRIYYRGVNNGNLGTQNVVTAPITNVQIGSWNHVVFQMGSAPAGDHMSAILNDVYVDHVPKNSPVAQNTLPLIIGGGVHIWNAANDRYFGLGRLDDIRIYNRVLSNPEISVLYNQIPINSFNQPISITNNNALCLNNDSLIITATSQPGLSYSWTGPNSTSYSTNQIIIENPTASHAGTYTLVPNYDGCPRPSLTVNITPPLPQLTLNGPTQVCLNSPFSYSVVNNPAATYSWQFPASGTPNGNVLNVGSASVAEEGQYSLQYTLNGCIGFSDTLSLVTVQQYSITRFDTICQGQSILLGGAQQTNAGTYQDTYLSITGCDSTVTTELHVKPQPQVSLGADQQSCVGSTVTLNAVTNGTLTVWSTNETSASIDVTTSGNYWFEAILDGCTARDTATVSFFLIPAAVFTANDATQCLQGNSFNFFPTNNFAPGTTFAWTFTGASTPASAVQNPTGIVWDSDGTFPVSLEVTENGCLSQPATLNITVYPQPVANFTASPTQGCEPVEVKYNNTTQSAVLYNSAWVLGDGSLSSDNSPVHVYQQDGNYNVTLTVTDNNGCVDTEIKPNFITVYPQPIAGFSLLENNLTTTAPVLVVSSEAQQATSCLYYLNDGTAWTDCSFTATIQGSGTFTITQVVTSGFGCIDSVSQMFTVRPTPEVFVPNTFTPNGDFVNERFEPSISWIGEYNIMIFDRWGGVIFQTDDLFTYWNGREQNYGKEVPQGVYVYKIRYRPYQLEKDFYVTGSVTLIR